MKFNNTFRILLILLILVPVKFIHSQEWPKIFANNFDAYINRIIEDYDHGYLLGGDIFKDYYTFKYPWIIKTDINGNKLWDKKYGNGIDQNYMVSCAKTSDGGIIACGLTTIEDPQLDPFFFKLNACGEVEWCKIILSQGYNGASDIIAIEDGYVGMLQYYRNGIEYRISLLKMNLEGEPLWIQYLAQEDTLIFNEEGDFLYLTKDQNYLVSGECFHPGLQPYWIKADTAGNQIWDLMWSEGQGGAWEVIEDSNSFFYSAGGYRDVGQPFKPTLFKFDNDGNRIYRQYLLGDTIMGGGAECIAFLNDSVLLTGINWGNNPINVDDGYSEILKIDTLGNTLNRRMLLHENRCPSQIIRTHDNKILVAGFYVVNYFFDIYLWKMNAGLEDDSIFTQPITYDSLCPYQIQSDTLDLDCSLFVNINEIPTKEEYESTIKISPNPAGDWIMLTLPDVVSPGGLNLEIYNIFGQEVMKKRISLQNRSVSINISDLSPGFYFAVCRDAKRKVFKGKFIVAR
jgi:hypothetical protein